MTRGNLFEQVSSDYALALLKEGNKRFVEGKPLSSTNGDTPKARKELYEKGQAPFAVILGCSDSRVPPELVFDVNVGQLFIVRTAGNVADAIAAGSVEYAVEHLKAKLVVVLGHQKCGAVAAAISGGDFGDNIGAIVKEINPSVEKIRAEGGSESLTCRCEDENAKNTAAKLSKSTILSKYIADGSLKIVCAKYILETGEVSFF
ncbi:MAG: carbonic anhydrase [Oscillospiraceae bacterium]|nr:carbonic anhydrase [Oscillospiraceae bacterium]